MIKKNVAYKFASVLLFAFALGSTAGYAQNTAQHTVPSAIQHSACSSEPSIPANLASGRLQGSKPVLTEVKVNVNHLTGDSVDCEYVQKNSAGKYDSFVIKKVAASPRDAIDVVKKATEWSPIKNAASVCYPSGANTCQFTGLDSQSVTAGDYCTSLRREVELAKERGQMDRFNKLLTLLAQNCSGGGIELR